MRNALRVFLTTSALIVLGTSFAMADTVNAVTTSTGFASNDSLDWGQLGVNNHAVADGSTATSSNGITTTMTFGAGGVGETFVQCPGSGCTWTGDFAPGANVLGEVNIMTDNNSIFLSFGTGISSVGFQMEPDLAPTTFTTQIQVYISGVLADTFMEPGTADGNIGSNSAGFYGIEDVSGANITAIDISAINCSDSYVGVNCFGLGINQLRLEDTPAPTPEPGTLTLLGSGLLLLGFVRRKVAVSY